MMDSGENPPCDKYTHSRVYELITEKLEDPEDPIGLFAYAIYKKEKMNEIARLRVKLGVAHPKNSDLENFVGNAETRVDSFISQSEDKLAALHDELVGQYLDDLREEYANKYKQEIEKFQPQQPPSWFKQAIYGLAGNILTLLVTFVLLVLAMVSLEGAPSLAQFGIRLLSKYAGS